MKEDNNKQLTCGWCGGVGQVSDGYNGRRDCEVCKGRGELLRKGQLCPNCAGQGYRADPYSSVYPMTLPCRDCEGTGTLLNGVKATTKGIEVQNGQR